jgi:hypothetical protein
VCEHAAEPKERFAYHMPGTGADGGGSAGAVGPILRTRDEDASKPTNWATQYGSTVHDERYYYNSDFRGNASAIVSSGGNLIEQYRYSATGVPFGIARGDVNADGVVGTPGGGGGGTVAAFTATSNADYDQAVYLVKNNIYEVRADWNLDGVIDAADTAVVAAAVGTATGRKTMSAVGVGYRLGMRGKELANVASVVAGAAQWGQRGPSATMKREPTEDILSGPEGFAPPPVFPPGEEPSKPTPSAPPTLPAPSEPQPTPPAPREPPSPSPPSSDPPDGLKSPPGGTAPATLPPNYTPPSAGGDCSLRIRSTGGIINHFWIEWDEKDGTRGVGFWPGTPRLSPFGPGHWFPGKRPNRGNPHAPSPGDSDPNTGLPRQDGDGSQVVRLCFVPGSTQSCADAIKCLQNYTPRGTYNIFSRQCQSEAYAAMRKCGLVTCGFYGISHAHIEQNEQCR